MWRRERGWIERMMYGERCKGGWGEEREVYGRCGGGGSGGGRVENVGWCVRRKIESYRCTG